MNLRLILCAFGWHRWYYQARSRFSETNDQRTCGDCQYVEVFSVEGNGRWVPHP